jgi:ParB family chromosome partitioning protein
MKIKLNDILPNPDQPRTVFDEAELQGLAQSIRENGVIVAITVETAGDKFILVDGERRWRASQIAGLKTIEATVRASTNHGGFERLTHALVANIQRSAMGPIDEAKAYERLMKELKTLEAVADKVGVSITTVSTRLTLLTLAEPVQKLFNLGRIPLDGQIIAKLTKFPAERQVQLASTGATRRWSSASFNKALTIALKNGTKSQKNFVLQGHRKRPELVIDGHFDALAMVPDHKKLPNAIIKTARATCRACDLYGEACLAICKQCPLPDFLRRLKDSEVIVQ